jgi:hypothetical protein
MVIESFQGFATPFPLFYFAAQGKKKFDSIGIALLNMAEMWQLDDR